MTRPLTPAAVAVNHVPDSRSVAAAMPIVVSDQTSLAVLGMDDRQFRELVRQRAIPHRKWKRHIFALVADVLAALGLTTNANAGSPPSEASALTEAEAITLAVGPRRSR